MLTQLGGTGAVVKDCEYPVPTLEADFSLNVANALATDLLLSTTGVARLTPTHDLNAMQLAFLATALGNRGRQLEAVLHQYLPIFHTEHCVFARFLCDGNSYVDCGHPCERHAVHLRDENGRDNLVLADQGCRNTVFDASAQSALPFISELVEAGYGCFRVELMDEPVQFVAPLLERYKAVLVDVVQSSGNVAAAQKRQKELWQWLEQLPDANGRVHGVVVGSLEVRGERDVVSMKQTAAALKAKGSSTGGRCCLLNVKTT